MTKQVGKRNLFTKFFWIGLGGGIFFGWLSAQLAWVYGQLRRLNVQETIAVHKNLARKGLIADQTYETPEYTVSSSVEDGIERIVYYPKNRRHQTPILMQHGMWHGAWCWKLWQEIFAREGWETHAFSLPGHGGSPVQRPVPLCTLDYYLGFLKAEVERFPEKPVLLGHSMGGALLQWYLKYVGDNLPAVILVAPWVSHNAFRESFHFFVQHDPVGVLSVALTWSTSGFVRNPRLIQKLLLTEGAVVTPEDIYNRIGPESALVVFQHNPPFWQPPEDIHTPMLWIAPMQDALISEKSQRKSAAYYKADYVRIKNTGHDLMVEKKYAEIAEVIQKWLLVQDIL